jgi:translation initiation factor 3 subunit F
VPSATSKAHLSLELDSVERALRTLSQSLGTVSEHVRKVLDGTEKGDPKVGKFLMDTLASIPKFEANQFERAFNSQLQVMFIPGSMWPFYVFCFFFCHRRLTTVFVAIPQDILMVIYLANLTRTQLAIAEKLHNTAL